MGVYICVWVSARCGRPGVALGRVYGRREEKEMVEEEEGLEEKDCMGRGLDGENGMWG